MEDKNVIYKCKQCEKYFGINKDDQNYPMTLPCGNNHNVCRKCSINMHTCPFDHNDLRDQSPTISPDLAAEAKTNLKRFRIFVLGDKGAGKTSLIKQFHGISSPSQDSRLPVTEVQVGGYLWEFTEYLAMRGGIQQAGSLISREFKQKDCYLIIIDVNMKNIHRTFQCYYEEIDQKGEYNKPIIVLFNKIDLLQKKNIEIPAHDFINGYNISECLDYSTSSHKVNIIYQILEKCLPTTQGIYI